MNRRLPRFLTALVLLVAVATTIPVCEATAQGFNSISSAPPVPAVAPITVEVMAPAETPVPAGAAGPIVAPTAALPPTAGLPPVAGVQTLAALGFSSISSVSPVLPDPAAPTGPGANPSGSASSLLADKVLVDKSERRLYLLNQGRVIAEYPVKLGLNPFGHKQREGDFRTPEGRYTLVRRNPQSEFYLSIQVSYPNREDAAVAREAGHAPGGLIMIHGQPNVPKRPAEYYASRDWTDGCIALSNADMIDVWQRTTVGLPIEIRP